MLEPDEMAALIGLRWPTYMAVETGRSALTLKTVRKIRAFNPKLLAGIIDADVLKSPNKTNQIRGPVGQGEGFEGAEF